MSDPDLIEVLWTPAGVTLADLGARALLDVTDGDTPNVRMPVRLLSVDTPEITARTAARAATVDEQFAQLAQWITTGQAPISARLGQYLLPRLPGAGTRQFEQGSAASAFAKDDYVARLTRPDGSTRHLFIRVPGGDPFDDNNRLLAYLSPSYSRTELDRLPREQRATFNLDLVTSGWAAPFVIYPAIPGQLDLPLLVRAAHDAREQERGIWADEQVLLPYEYRAAEQLHQIMRRLVAGEDLPAAARYAWRERYCADLRDRVLHGPEDYIAVPPEYRLWVWPADVAEAMSRLNLTPAPVLVTPP